MEWCHIAGARSDGEGCTTNPPPSKKMEVSGNRAEVGVTETEAPCSQRETGSKSICARGGTGRKAS